MNMQHQPAAPQAVNAAKEPQAFVLDFDSDEPLPVCPMRKDGMGAGEICDSCQ